jgi:hypothetical protein
MTVVHIDELRLRAEEVYRDLERGEYRPIAEQMSFLARRSLTEDRLMTVWSEVHERFGGLESLGESFVRPSGRTTVVETPLTFDTGALAGRIAFDRRGRLVGLLVLPPEALPTAAF